MNNCGGACAFTVFEYLHGVVALDKNAVPTIRRTRERRGGRHNWYPTPALNHLNAAMARRGFGGCLQCQQFLLGTKSDLRMASLFDVMLPRLVSSRNNTADLRKFRRIDKKLGRSGHSEVIVAAARGLGTRLQFCEVVQKSASRKRLASKFAWWLCRQPCFRIASDRRPTTQSCRALAPRPARLST
jgi:hypothetical protein